jgi:hypothetical protein
MAGTNFDVFLETLNQTPIRSNQNPDVISPNRGQQRGMDTFQITDAAPVLSALVESPDAMTVELLAGKTQLKVTPLVLTLQKLVDFGVVAHDADHDTFALTDVGRQMLAVGKMVR